MHAVLGMIVCGMLMFHCIIQVTCSVKVLQLMLPKWRQDKRCMRLLKAPSHYFVMMQWHIKYFRCQRPTFSGSDALRPPSR